MREIVHIQAGQCGNQIGAKVRKDKIHLMVYSFKGKSILFIIVVLSKLMNTPIDNGVSFPHVCAFFWKNVYAFFLGCNIYTPIVYIYITSLWVPVAVFFFLVSTCEASALR